MKRSKFSLSNYKLLSLDMGELVPIGVMEVLPGDTIQHSTSALVRASPLLAPVMHPVHVHIRHFFVPYRLLWVGFEDFITGGPDGLNVAAVPQFDSDKAGIHANGSLGDYLGLPTTFNGNQRLSAFPFRAYNMIWNEYYRDQDLQSELLNLNTGGLDITSNTTLQRVNWEKDYFTSARPWEQKGVSIQVPVWTNSQNVQMRYGVTPTVDRSLIANATQDSLRLDAVTANNTSVRFGTQTGLQVSIQLLREAFAIQRYEEARARFGSRYTEYLRYLGVRSSDARLQRPEYLGGGSQTIQFSEVLQTAEGSDPVGDLKGHGIAAMRSNRYRRFFEEHGIVLTLVS